MLAGLINKKNLAVHIIQALIWATGWQVLLWIDDYPLNEWVGVVVLGYLAWYVSYTLIDNALRFALARAYQYVVSFYGELKNESASVSKRMEWAIAFFVGIFIYSAIFITTGFMFILTWLGLNALDFPMLNTNIRLVGLISVSLGLIMMMLPLSTVIYILALGRSRVLIRERFMHVSALAWSLITKERFMPKWGFGLNSQIIERSTLNLR